MGSESNASQDQGGVTASNSGCCEGRHFMDSLVHDMWLQAQRAREATFSLLYLDTSPW